MRFLMIVIMLVSILPASRICYADDSALIGGAADVASNFGPIGSLASGVLKTIGGAIQNSFETLASWAQSKSPIAVVTNVLLYLLQDIGNALIALNDQLFGQAFGLLMVYMDFTSMTQIQSAFNSLYGLISGIAYTLIALMVITSLFLLITNALFQDTSAKLASVGGALALSVVVSVALISATPTIFSKTTGVMYEICSELMNNKVQGENIDYSTAINISNLGSSNMLTNALNSGINQVSQSANTAVNNDISQLGTTNNVQSLETQVNNSIGDPSSKLTTYVQNQIPELSGSGSNDQQVENDFASKAKIILLQIFVAIGSISMLLTLLCVKGVQLLSLFVMLLIAPLVTMFLILPRGYTIVINFWKEILGLLSAPIVWAILIKVYFLIKLAFGDSTAGSLVSAVDYSSITGQKLLLLFMELALLVSMLSVSAIIGKVLIASTLSNASHMAAMLTSVPATVGSMVGTAVGVGAGTFALGSLVSNHGIGGAASAIGKATVSKHGGLFSHALNNHAPKLNYDNPVGQRNVINGMSNNNGLRFPSGNAIPPSLPKNFYKKAQPIYSASNPQVEGGNDQ